MLELRPSCENCSKALPPESTDAMMCSFECTYCKACVEQILQDVCPNCGGNFAPRPIRPSQNRKNENYLGKHPASTRVVHKSVDLDAHASFAAKLKDISPEDR